MNTGKHTAKDTLNKDTPRRERAPTQAAGRPSAEETIVEITPDRMRLRAYEIYQARNGGPGDALADWVQAEHELSGGARRIPEPAHPPST
jgi:hypothetical protein